MKRLRVETSPLFNGALAAEHASTASAIPQQPRTRIFGKCRGPHGCGSALRNIVREHLRFSGHAMSGGVEDALYQRASWPASSALLPFSPPPVIVNKGRDLQFAEHRRSSGLHGFMNPGGRSSPRYRHRAFPKCRWRLISRSRRMNVAPCRCSGPGQFNLVHCRPGAALKSLNSQLLPASTMKSRGCRWPSNSVQQVVECGGLPVGSQIKQMAFICRST